MTPDHQVPEEARQLLSALREAGCTCFNSDGEFYCSPPSRPVRWLGDPEEDILVWQDELATLMRNELGAAVH